VYLSPEKFIRCYDRLAPLHGAQRLTLFAIDEAHCVSVRLAVP
jgi:superfamily II DNA helicase RecQ